MAVKAWTVNGEALSNREVIEAEIERLIGLLDFLDGDTDLEPSLGIGGDGTFDDREGDGADDECCGDFEPWLGAPECMSPRLYTMSLATRSLAATRPDLFDNEQPERTFEGSQLCWASGGGDDLELAVGELASLE